MWTHRDCGKDPPTCALPAQKMQSPPSFGRSDWQCSMPQIFRRSANTLARISIVGLLILAGGLVGLLIVIGRSSYVTRAEEFVEQPIQFSHLHHVGDDGIDCRYCHTSVETSAFAGIPPTKTCMNCHSQLWANSPILEPVRASFRDDTSLHWIRVHDLPDFVYFNHSIHIKKGMGCETCHGRVDEMPLMFQQNSLQTEWCINCHRAPEQFVRPRSEIFTMGYRPNPDEPQEVLGPRLVKEYGIQSLTTCSTCHR